MPDTKMKVNSIPITIYVSKQYIIKKVINYKRKLVYIGRREVKNKRK